jgi:hypothetical protein
VALKSRVPEFPDLNSEQFRYLEGLDRRLPARADLDGGASAAEIVTAFNTLLAELRNAKIMER